MASAGKGDGVDFYERLAIETSERRKPCDIVSLTFDK